ncbi:hypothetical protein [Duganella sp. Leaf61]|uniref:hypothetical protein n=1 Tax=Duganella sp. Leaf61 TaxID=1736227 RepID=UPI0012E0CA12|nr:hypothetical protein [Duganella sp. Leaf61]
MGGLSSDSRVQAGSTILIPSGPTGDHLFVVVLGGKIINGKESLLLASFSTARHATDDMTCPVSPGEHPFIVDASFIAYSKCRSDPLIDVIARLNDGYFRAKQAVSPALLERIRQGLSVEKSRIRRDIKDDWGLW